MAAKKQFRFAKLVKLPKLEIITFSKDIFNKISLKVEKQYEYIYISKNKIRFGKHDSGRQNKFCDI